MAKTTLPQPITMLDTKKAETTITPPQSLMNITMMGAHTADSHNWATHWAIQSPQGIPTTHQYQHPRHQITLIQKLMTPGTCMTIKNKTTNKLIEWDTAIHDSMMNWARNVFVVLLSPMVQRMYRTNKCRNPCILPHTTTKQRRRQPKIQKATPNEQ